MLVVIAGWIHREQQKTIEFYQAQLKALMEAQGKVDFILRFARENPSWGYDRIQGASRPLSTLRHATIAAVAIDNRTRYRPSLVAKTRSKTI